MAKLRTKFHGSSWKNLAIQPLKFSPLTLHWCGLGEKSAGQPLKIFPINLHWQEVEFFFLLDCYFICTLCTVNNIQTIIWCPDCTHFLYFRLFICYTVVKDLPEIGGIYFATITKIQSWQSPHYKIILGFESGKKSRLVKCIQNCIASDTL